MFYKLEKLILFITFAMKLSIIGGGAMGGALARGLINTNHVSPKDIIISDPVTSHLTDLQEKGVKIISANKEAAKDADFVVVAVKPWLISEVISDIAPAINIHKSEVCCIVAGIKAADIYNMFKANVPDKLSIAIPNTAMAVAESMTFVVSVNGKPDIAMTVFGYLGKAMEIEERLLPAATALASCGIAFAMRYVRASCEGGVELGFKASQAKDIVCQTLTGAVALLSNPDSHPEVEIDKVTTPGGITIKGLNAMERFGFTTAVIEGLKACK